jgi:NADH dehydrogenase FAD-containing subunit
MNLNIGLLLLLTMAPAHGFAPRPSSSFPTRLFYKDATDDSPTSEADLVTQTTSPGEISPKSQQDVDMDKLKKLRPYPLFVAEKVAGVFDSVLYGLSKLSSDDASTKTKERVVVLGSGWGAASFISELDSDLYDITVVSPRNHFIFTPFLAGSSVGSVEYRSICEPIREFNRQAQYFEATATEIDTSKRTVKCLPVSCESCNLVAEFTINYDYLLVTIGAKTNTFGIPGVQENCSFLKEIQDAKTIRTKIVSCFERANMPNLSDELKGSLLTFVVVGAGPAGVEFASELRDFVEQDGSKYYPELLKYVKIKVIEATNTVLAPFEKPLQEEAIQRMSRPVRIKDPKARNLLPSDYKLQEVLLNSPVSRVDKNIIHLKDGREIKYGGLCVWAGGNGPVPLTQQLIESLGEEQRNVQNVARGRIAIDRWMRALGGDGRVLALGDCTCVIEDQVPATGQVASQQGEYLANLMNRKYNLSTTAMEDGTLPPPPRDMQRVGNSLEENIAALTTGTTEFAKPFQFLNLGLLAYTGDCTALAQVSTAPKAPAIKSTGKLGNTLWRSVYLGKQVSWRNRLLVLNDWMKRVWFGRDITQL